MDYCRHEGGMEMWGNILEPSFDPGLPGVFFPLSGGFFHPLRLWGGWGPPSLICMQRTVERAVTVDSSTIIQSPEAGAPAFLVHHQPPASGPLFSIFLFFCFFFFFTFFPFTSSCGGKEGKKVLKRKNGKKENYIFATFYLAYVCIYVCTYLSQSRNAEMTRLVYYIRTRKFSFYLPRGVGQGTRQFERDWKMKWKEKKGNKNKNDSMIIRIIEKKKKITLQLAFFSFFQVHFSWRKINR